MLVGLFLSAFAVVGQITIVGKQVFDRRDRRVVWALALVVEAGVSFSLFLYAESDPTSVLPIFGLMVVFGAARSVALIVAPECDQREGVI